MPYNAEPDFVMHYCIQETALSPLVRRMTFSTEHGEGVMCLLELWTGVQVWTIDFHVPQLPIRPTGDYHYLKLNFCTGGRCEVPLPAGYIYIDQGTLSVDVNPPVGVMLCPGGCYQGLEMAVDLEMCGGNVALWDYLHVLESPFQPVVLGFGHFKTVQKIQELPGLPTRHHIISIPAFSACVSSLRIGSPSLR